MARAVIAAARAYGDDPVRACTSRALQHRRALAAAAGGLNLALGLPLGRVSRVLQVSPSGVYTNRSKRGATFIRAERAAERACRYAAWRPEHAPSAPSTAARSPSPAPQAGEVEIAAPPAPSPSPVRGTVEKALPPALTRELPGRIAATCRPAFLVPDKALSATSLRDRIQRTLADGSATTQGLATILDVKELNVGQTLTALQHEGLVAAGDMPPEGRRAQRWRLAGADHG